METQALYGALPVQAGLGQVQGPANGELYGYIQLLRCPDQGSQFLRGHVVGGDNLASPQPPHLRAVAQHHQICPVRHGLDRRGEQQVLPPGGRYNGHPPPVRLQ